MLPSLKKPIIKVNLSKREKNLLFLLIVIIFSWASIRFIILPQLNKLEALEGKKKELETNISQINALISMEGSIKEELQNLKINKLKLANSFFNPLTQQQIISLLDEILMDESFLPQDIVFFKPTEEQFENISLMKIDVEIPYTGDYGGILRVLRAISSYSKKIIVNSIIMDTASDKLTGSISLSFYGLNQVYDSNEEQNDFIRFTGDLVEDPFNPINEYTDDIPIEEKVEPIEDEQKESVEEKYSKELLEDFDEGDFEFIPSNKYVQGNVFKSKISKDKNFSLRLEYFIMAIEDENRASIDINNRDIWIKYPPYTIGMWIYSYGYSPSNLGLKFKTQNNEEVDIVISEGISWIGWNYVESGLPLDLSLYPLKLDKIYIELTNYRDDFGVLLFDRIEANYPKNSNNLGRFFEYHIVREGESLEDISIKYYGTASKKSLIKEYNELTSDDISIGRVLVIPR